MVKRYYTKERERDILQRWEKQAMFNKDLNFTYDGLILRGPATQDDSLNWTYQEGDEERMWNDDPGILYLTKDVNGECGDDIRTWTGRKKDSNVMISSPFFSNLMRWTYGFAQLLNHKDPLTFFDIDDRMAMEVYDKYPIARINCKKEAGGGECPDNVILEYFNKPGYLELLKEEIELFSGAKIIYCGGEVIFQIFNRCFPEIIPIDTGFYKKEKYVYLAEICSHRTIVINGFHPSYPGRRSAISKEDAYDDLMWNVSKCLQ